MLFNSFEFLFAFLPVTVVLYRLLMHRSLLSANAILLLASLVFYAWWNYPYVVLMLASTLGNYVLSIWIDRGQGERSRQSRFMFSVGFNLLVLGYFKYMDFFIGSVNSLLATNWPLWNIILPIGVSFFTFTQINYLIEVRHRRQGVPPLLDYALYVSFFPHLIAGPILKYSELDQLFVRRQQARLSEDVAVGIAIFAVGLFKKIVVGDTMAQFADPVFAGAQSGANLTVIEAWTGVLCFAVQIYCDFSGYSDMAIGLARLFAVQLPTNFVSPYQATSISEFWRRWHTTLSRFLRDALYIPLGGSRIGRWRRDFSLLLTMLIGGLWHGANWTFVGWGGLHGAFLVINHRFRDLKRAGSFMRHIGPPRALAWAITFVCVVSAWVLFRADTFATARSMFEGMFGFNGVRLPELYADKLGGLKASIERFGIEFGPMPYWRGIEVMQWLVPSVLGLILLPNLQQIFRNFGGTVAPLPVDAGAVGPWASFQHRLASAIAWNPSAFWFAAITGFYLIALSMLLFKGSDAFIYFQF